MPRSFLRSAPFQYVVGEGQEFEVEFSPADKSGVKARYKVNGRIAFPERRGPQPSSGDIWKVKIAGANPTGSVYFLKCIARISTQAERDAAQRADQEVKGAWYRKSCELKEAAQAVLDRFTDWDNPSPLIEVEWLSLPVTIKYVGHKVTQFGIEDLYEAKAKYEIYEIDAVAKRVVFCPWSQVDFAPYKTGAGFQSTQDNKPCITIQTPEGKKNQAFPYYLYPLIVSVDWGKFIAWNLTEPGKVLAAVEVMVPDGPKHLFEVEVGWFDKEQGKVVLANKTYPGWEPNLIDCTPEMGPEQLDHLEEAKAAYQNVGQSNKSAGLLSVPAAVIYYVRDTLKQPLPGLGWNQWTGDQADPSNEGEPGVIHPDLLPLFQGATMGFKDVQVEFLPAVMRKGAPANAWEKIEWPWGNTPNPEIIKAFRGETVEVVVKPSESEIQDHLKKAREEGRCEGNIIPLEVNEMGNKFRFDLEVMIPHLVTVCLKHNFGFNQVVVKPQSAELRPYVFEGVARGNERFSGKVNFKVEWLKSRRYGYSFAPTWEASETKDETKTRQIEAIREVIRYGREYKCVLTGWIFTDTNNPVVYLTYANDNWQPYEFDREKLTFSRRKGSCSTKGDFWSDDAPSQPQLTRALENYRANQWPVEPVGGWQEKMGKSITSIFPADLIKKLEGGADGH